MPKIVKIWSETLAVTHKGFAVSCLLSVKWLTGGLGQYQRRILSDPQCEVISRFLQKEKLFFIESYYSKITKKYTVSVFKEINLQ